MHSLISAFRGAEPFKFNEFDGGIQAFRAFGMLAIQMNLTEFLETLSLTHRYARCDLLEIAVMREKDRIVVLSHLGHQWIG
jgi:hypothetical protein